MNGVSKLFLRIRIKRLEWARQASSTLAARLLARGEHECAQAYIRRAVTLARDIREAEQTLVSLGA